MQVMTAVNALGSFLLKANFFAEGKHLRGSILRDLGARSKILLKNNLQPNRSLQPNNNVMRHVVIRVIRSESFTKFFFTKCAVVSVFLRAARAARGDPVLGRTTDGLLSDYCRTYCPRIVPASS